MNSVRFAIFAIVFVLLLQINTYGNSQVTESIDQLKEISQVMNNHNITINEWSIYAREDATTYSNKTSYEEKVQSIIQSQPTFDWIQSIEDGMYKLTGTDNYANTSVKEQIIFVAYPHKEQFKTYLIYEVKGETWNSEEWLNFSSTYQSKLGNLFDINPLIFSCIKGQSSDNMEGVLYNQALNLLEDFSAKPIKALNEEAFVSISAYTENWKNIIPEKNEEMNIQIALRNQGLGGSTTVVIGTPIITSEY